MTGTLLIAATELAAWATLIATLAGAALKIWSLLTENKETRAKLDRVERVVNSVGNAINEMTPKLGVDAARDLKGKVATNAALDGVNEELDDLVKRFGLNERPTSELADPHQP